MPARGNDIGRAGRARNRGLRSIVIIPRATKRGDQHVLGGFRSTVCPANVPGAAAPAPCPRLPWRHRGCWRGQRTEPTLGRSFATICRLGASRAGHQTSREVCPRLLPRDAGRALPESPLPWPRGSRRDRRRGAVKLIMPCAGVDRCGCKWSLSRNRDGVASTSIIMLTIPLRECVNVVRLQSVRGRTVAKDWATTIAELITYPVTVLTDAVDWAIGTEPHERLSSIVKTEVFMDSHLRNLDKISGDRNLYLGDVMRVSRRVAVTIPYFHYGIYVGSGRVIHFTEDAAKSSPPKNVIKRTSISMFFKDADLIEMLEFPKEIDFDGTRYKTFSPANAAKRATKRLGDGDYHLFVNNCEHFAMWCRTGIEFSSQVLGVRDFILSAIGMPLAWRIAGSFLGNPVIPLAANVAATAALAASTRRLRSYGVSVSRVIFSSNCIGI
jgi:hypothetical protein